MELNMLVVQDLIRAALLEDIGHGDITTEALFEESCQGSASVLAKQDGVIAGLHVAREVFRTLDQHIMWKDNIKDGQAVKAGTILATVSGSLRTILTGERLALNFLQRMSGIATTTDLFVRAITAYHAKVVDTRKTTPGLRVLEKYAVRLGGGTNHRFGLYDAAMVKDNHIKAAGSISNAVSAIRLRAPFNTMIEVETESLEEVREAIDCKVNIIMLDNMPTEMMKQAVKIINGRAIVEASGGITLDTITAVAATGVDIISVGQLTHHIKTLDISLEMQ